MKKILYPVFTILIFILFSANVFSQANKHLVLNGFLKSQIELLSESGEGKIVKSCLYSSIQAERNDAAVRIVWSVNAKPGNRYFIIERSEDGNNFEAIGSYKENSKHNSYEFIDEHPLSVSYYRVKQINFEEGHQISEVVVFSF